MIEKIIIAGAGGQGVMLLGKVLANAALKDNLNVTWLPSYGAEVRWGAAHCMVIISSGDIPSPYIDKADTLIIMNEPSLLKFKQRIKNKGLLLINSSLIKTQILANHPPEADQPAAETQIVADKKSACICVQSANICALPFTEAAVKLGNIKVANMIALGSYIARKKIFSKQTVFKVIEEIVPAEKKSLIEINKQALLTGIELIRR